MNRMFHIFCKHFLDQEKEPSVPADFGELFKHHMTKFLADNQKSVGAFPVSESPLESSTRIESDPGLYASKSGHTKQHSKTSEIQPKIVQPERPQDPAKCTYAAAHRFLNIKEFYQSMASQTFRENKNLFRGQLNTYPVSFTRNLVDGVRPPNNLNFGTILPQKR